MDLDFTHIFLPKQSIATPEEVENVLQQFGIAKHQLPRMKSDDPVAKALNAQPGDVVKCVRASPITQQEEWYYRVVVES